MRIEEIIGDYQTFSSTLFGNLAKLRIDIREMPMSHICYRVETMPEHETVHGELKSLSRMYAETTFRERPVSLFILKSPLRLKGSKSIPMIELPAPRATRLYPTGLEHLGIIVGRKISEFKKRYKGVLTGEKDRTYYTLPFVTFPNGATAKFYEHSLKEIVEREGWKFSEDRRTGKLRKKLKN